MLSTNHRLLAVLAMVFAALAVGTLIRVAMLRGAAPELVRSRLESLRTWWLLACLFAFAVAIGELGVLLALTIVAFLGVWEFLSLLGWQSVGPDCSYLHRDRVGLGALLESAHCPNAANGARRT